MNILNEKFLIIWGGEGRFCFSDFVIQQSPVEECMNVCRRPWHSGREWELHAGGRRFESRSNRSGVNIGLVPLSKRCKINEFKKKKECMGTDCQFDNIADF